MRTVVICDTEPVAIEGLRALLAGVELRVAAAEICLDSGVEAVRELRPSLLVVDKAFGLRSVLETARALTGFGSETRLVVWGATLTESETLRLMHAGAAGVVRKTAPLESILECVATVAAGATWMETSGLTAEGGRPARLPLTTRELQVMDLVERGLTNREIAAELGIRSGTVKIHLKHIFEKTGVRGRYGLALTGLREKGLLLTPAVM